MLARFLALLPASLTPRQIAAVFALAWLSVIAALLLAEVLHRRNLKEPVHG